MFNLEYLAANVGAEISNGGTAFAYKTLTSDATGKVLLGEAAQPLTNGGTVYAYARKSSENVKMEKYPVDATDNSFTVGGITAATEFCVMYNKAVEGEKITINSQFIPDTLHAILTVALYSGDACNPDSTTKAGEVVIDIPRFQLSGAQDISMSATGAAQVALDGNALASGCTSCDGDAIYATITRVITGAHWYDDAKGLIIEDLTGLKAPVTAKPVVVYAYYQDKSPRKLANNEWTLAVVSGTGSADDTNKTISIAQAGTVVISATAKDAQGQTIATISTTKAVIVSA